MFILLAFQNYICELKNNKRHISESLCGEWNSKTKLKRQFWDYPKMVLYEYITSRVKTSLIYNFVVVK